jgi:hypothetical protein
MTRSGHPYLSLVATARNDNHGGDLLGRMQIFVSAWLEEARRYDISSELIIVEWNPPPDRPRLAEVLSWPENFGPCEVRFIEVPPELHRRQGHAEVLPLYQMIAKNVGIRRASGRFVLATNIDIVFSLELASFLAEGKLQPGRMYRIDRHDVSSGVPRPASLGEQLDYCRDHVIRVNRREGTFSAAAGEVAAEPVKTAEPEPAANTFEGETRDGPWRCLQRQLARLANAGPDGSASIHVSPRVSRLLKEYVNSGGFTGMARHWASSKGVESRNPAAEPAAAASADAAVRAGEGTPAGDGSPPRLHTNGCGDFTLMAREHWFDLRAYPEFDLFSMNLDSVLCFSAHHGGARELVLADPMRIYHIEHGSGSGWTPEGEGKLFERISSQGLSILSNEQVLRWAAEMRRLQSPMIFNRENWGMAREELKETVLP